MRNFRTLYSEGYTNYNVTSTRGDAILRKKESLSVVVGKIIGMSCFLYAKAILFFIPLNI